MTVMVEEQTYVLNAADRCDRCGSQAYVWVNMIAGDLQFCGHHFARYEDALKPLAIEIVDERAKINARSESSA